MEFVSKPVGNQHDLPVYEVLVNGCKIHYASIGTGPGLVLVHGLRNNWQGWGNLIPQLRNHFTVYALDLPGYGDSGDLESYSIQIMAEYVVAFMHTLPEHPVGVVGLSMGSSITAEVGKLDGEHLAGIVLAGPVLKSGRTIKLLGVMKLLMRIAGSNHIFRFLLKKSIESKLIMYGLAKFLSMYEFKKELVDEYGTEGNLKMRAKTYPQMSLSVSDYDLLGTLENYSHPTLLIYGTADKASKPVYGLQLARRNSSIQSVQIEKAGHWVVVERPFETAAEIIKFYNAKSQL